MHPGAFVFLKGVDEAASGGANLLKNRAKVENEVMR